MSHINVGMMTSGGLAPCLSSSIAHLTAYWSAALKEGKISGLTIRMYKDGYKGVLIGESFLLPEDAWDTCDSLHELGGSPIGNSRVKVRFDMAFRNLRRSPRGFLLSLFADGCNCKEIRIHYHLFTTITNIFII